MEKIIYFLKNCSWVFSSIMTMDFHVKTSTSVCINFPTLKKETNWCFTEFFIFTGSQEFFLNGCNQNEKPICEF